MANKIVKLNKEVVAEISKLQKLKEDAQLKVIAYQSVNQSTLELDHIIKGIDYKIANLKQTNKIAAEPSAVSKTDVDKENIFTVVDPKASGDITQKIRPISLRFSQDVSSIDSQTDVKYTVTILWDDTQEVLVTVTYDESLKDSYAELQSKLTEIQKLVDGKNFELAQTQTANFLQDLTILRTKFQSNIVHACNNIYEDLGCSKIQLSSSGKMVVAKLSDTYIDYVTSGLEKVESEIVTPMDDVRYIGEDQCNADSYKLAYYGKGFGQTHGHVRLWKEKNLVGTFKASKEDFSKLYRKLAFTLDDLGYKHDRFQKFAKVEKKAGYVLSPIDINRAKLISKDWEVTEASAPVYFSDSTWKRNAISAEISDSNNKIIFRLKGGDFVVLENPLKKTVSSRKEAAVTMQNIYFDTVDEANKWQKELEKQKGKEEVAQVAPSKTPGTGSDNTDRTETTVDSNPEKQETIPSRKEESSEGADKLDFENAQKNDDVLTPTPSSKVEKGVSKQATTNVFSIGDKVVNTRMDPKDTGSYGEVVKVFPEDLSHVVVSWGERIEGKPNRETIIDTEFLKKDSSIKAEASKGDSKKCPTDICTGKLVEHKPHNTNHIWLMCDKCGILVETDKWNDAVGEKGKPVPLIRKEYQGNEKQVERKYDNDPEDIKNLKVKASGESSVVFDIGHIVTIKDSCTKPGVQGLKGSDLVIMEVDDDGSWVYFVEQIDPPFEGSWVGKDDIEFKGKPRPIEPKPKKEKDDIEELKDTKASTYSDSTEEYNKGKKDALENNVYLNPENKSEYYKGYMDGLTDKSTKTADTINPFDHLKSGELPVYGVIYYPKTYNFPNGKLYLNSGFALSLEEYKSSLEELIKVEGGIVLGVFDNQADANKFYREMYQKYQPHYVKETSFQLVFKKVAVHLQKGDAYVIKFVENSDFEYEEKAQAILKDFNSSIEERVTKLEALLKDEILPNIPETDTEFVKIKDVNWDSVELDLSDLFKLVEYYQEEHEEEIEVTGKNTPKQPLKETVAKLNTFKITYDNGDTVTTGFNGTLEDAKKYYVGNVFNLGNGGNDLMAKGVSVEQLETTVKEAVESSSPFVVFDSGYMSNSTLPRYMAIDSTTGDMWDIREDGKYGLGGVDLFGNITKIMKGRKSVSEFIEDARNPNSPEASHLGKEVQLADLPKDVQEKLMSIRKPQEKEAAKESRIDILKRIVENHQFEKIDGVIVDVQTANLLKQVYEGISDANKAKFDSIPLKKLIDFAWSMTKSSSTEGNMGRISAIPFREMVEKEEEWYAAKSTLEEQLKNQKEINVQKVKKDKFTENKSTK